MSEMANNMHSQGDAGQGGRTVSQFRNMRRLAVDEEDWTNCLINSATDGNCADACFHNFGDWSLPGGKKMVFPCEVTLSYPRACFLEVSCGKRDGQGIEFPTAWPMLKVTVSGSVAFDCPSAALPNGMLPHSEAFKHAGYAGFDGYGACAISGCLTVALTFEIDKPFLPTLSFDLLSLTICIGSNPMEDGCGDQGFFTVSVQVHLCVAYASVNLIVFNNDNIGPEGSTSSGVYETYEKAGSHATYMAKRFKEFKDGPNNLKLCYKNAWGNACGGETDMGWGIKRYNDWSAYNENPVYYTIPNGAEYHTVRVHMVIGLSACGWWDTDVYNAYLIGCCREDCEIELADMPSYSGVSG